MVADCYTMKTKAIAIALSLLASSVSAKEYMNKNTAPKIPAKIKTAAIQVSSETGIPASILLGIASRESDFRPLIGDNGNSYGMCQIHKRWHPEILTDGDWRCPVFSFRMCAKILKQNLRYCGLNWNKAVAAYNVGPKLANLHEDKYTTGGDYSEDVFRRATAFSYQL